jgi:hypothetical protein
MQGIYNYIPETNHVSRVYSVAAVLCLQHMVHVMLFPITNSLYFDADTFGSTSAAPSVPVVCSSLMSRFLPGMMFRQI